MRILFAILVLLSAVSAHAAGVASDDALMTCAPSEALAKELLHNASRLRAKIIREWLGEQPPASQRIGIIIHLELSDSKDDGMTMPMREAPHVIWLVTDHRRAMSCTLQHELTHAVFATKFGDGLPSWAHEGAASQCDDPERKAIRSSLIAGYRQSNRWPSVAKVLGSDNIRPSDQNAYTVASGVTELLVARGGKPKFLEFAMAGERNGYDRALREFYGIGSVRELERIWRGAS